MTSEQFKGWRKQMGLTQAEAAEALGISKPSVEHYEKGARFGTASRPVVISKTIALACAALVAGLKPYDEAAE